jgi:hypothetical protein
MCGKQIELRKVINALFPGAMGLCTKMQNSICTGPMPWVKWPSFWPAQSLAWPQKPPFSPPTHTCEHLTDINDINMSDSALPGPVTNIF